MELINYVIENKGKLPCEDDKVAYEKHPYIEYEKKQKTYPEKYIIGTFPPVSYLLDNPDIISKDIKALITPKGKNINSPKIPFFHGNKLTFWELLLKYDNFIELQSIENTEEKISYLLEWLKQNDIVYSDIIAELSKRKQYDTSDKNLIPKTDNMGLINSILHNPNSKAILFNTAGIFNKPGIKIYKENYNNNKAGQPRSSENRAFDLFLVALAKCNFKLSIKRYGDRYYEINKDNYELLKSFNYQVISVLKIENKTSNKSITKGSFNSKELYAVTGPSPSASARNSNKNEAFKKWKKNRQKDDSFIEFKKTIYKLFINSKWDELAKLNY